MATLHRAQAPGVLSRAGVESPRQSPLQPLVRAQTQALAPALHPPCSRPRCSPGRLARQCLARAGPAALTPGRGSSSSSKNAAPLQARVSPVAGTTRLSWRAPPSLLPAPAHSPSGCCGSSRPRPRALVVALLSPASTGAPRSSLHTTAAAAAAAGAAVAESSGLASGLQQGSSRSGLASPRKEAAAGAADAALSMPKSLSAAAAEKVVAVSLPRSIHDISNGDHILGFGAQLAEDHPGYHDEEYKRRRSELADLAKTHVIGEPIPIVDYSAEELETWSQVLLKLGPLYPTHACSHFLRSFPHFDFSPSRIPQLEELSCVLREKTGWQIRPVAGLLHPRDFLNGLAFRYFHSTQYIRHGSQPMYTPEPDICHELLGHVPMLADQEFADLAQAIGEASLGASEKEIWHLTKLYWYTVEFGTILEEGEVKAFGAGILSSYGELAYMRDGAVGKDGVFRSPSFVELDPFSKLPKMSYKDGFQRTYFLCSSFQDVSLKLRAYAASVKKATLVPPLQ